MSTPTVVRVFAEDAPRQTAWAVIEEGEAVDYRNTRREAEASARSIKAASEKPAKQDIGRSPDGRNAGKDACSGWGYCFEPTHQVVVFQNVQPHGSCECRWPVCNKHAKAYYFRHLGVPVKFEPK